MYAGGAGNLQTMSLPKEILNLRRWGCQMVKKTIFWTKPWQENFSYKLQASFVSNQNCKKSIYVCVLLLILNPY